MLTRWPDTMLSSESACVSVIGEDISLPPDGYQPLDWLRYVRAVYFEGCDYPLYPHINFDAKKLVDAVVHLGDGSPKPAQEVFALMQRH